MDTSEEIFTELATVWAVELILIWEVMDLEVVEISGVDTETAASWEVTVWAVEISEDGVTAELVAMEISVEVTVTGEDTVWAVEISEDGVTAWDSVWAVDFPILGLDTMDAKPTFLLL
jgi:hypothetical protein